MGNLANISGKEAVKAFQKAGWETVGQVGSHLVMVKAGADQSLYPAAQRAFSWDSSSPHTPRRPYR
jgi:hypothetical protein